MTISGKSDVKSLRVTRFIVRPRPYIDESWPGYLLRFANANGIHGIQPVAKVLGVGVFELIASDPNSILRKLSVIGPEETGYRAPLNTRAHCVSRRLLSRVCPECLRTQRYISIYWDYPTYVTCPAHGVQLIDTCPTCDKKLTYLRPATDRCRCNFDLKAARLSPLPYWWGDFERIFRLSREPIVPDSEAAITANLAKARPIFRIVSWQKMKRDVRRPLTVPRINSVDIPVIEQLLKEWPREFLCVVKAITDTLKPLRSSAFYRDLRRIGSVEINAALQQLAQTRRAPRISSPPLDNALPYLTIGSIRKLTKLNFYAARQLVQSPLLKGVKEANDPSHPHVRFNIPISEGHLLRQFLYETFSIQEIAARLMCSTQHIRSFVTMKLLTGLRLTKSGTSYRFKVDDVERLLAKLMSRVSTESPQSSKLVTLSGIQAFNKKRMVNPQWRVLIYGVIEGSIPVYSVGPESAGLSALAIRKVDLPRKGHRVRRLGAANMRQ